MAGLTREQRLSREQETQAAEDLHESYADNWESPLLLDTKNIPARPGFVQRWIRTRNKMGEDQSNIFKKINQGWKPRQRDSIPKGQFIPYIDFNGTQVIGIHGMILMERPEEMHKKHADYNRRAARLQEEAVRANLSEAHDPRSGLTAPRMYNESKMTIGRVPDIDD